MEQMSIIRITNSSLLYIQKSGCYFNSWRGGKKNRISFHGVAGLHKRLVLCTRRQVCMFWGRCLAMVMTRIDLLCSKDGCCSEIGFSFFKKKKVQKKECGCCGDLCWLLLRCPAMEYCVWRKYEHLSNRDAFTNRWQILFLFMSFYFR